VKSLCSTCKSAPRAPAASYCTSCRNAYMRAYGKAYRAQKRKPKHRTEELMADWDLEPYARSRLRLEDNSNPATVYLEAYCGWGVDRYSSPFYRRSHFICSNDWSELYMMGHYAVQRFWLRMSTASLWEMGPDQTECMDGGWNRMSRPRRKR